MARHGLLSSSFTGEWTYDVFLSFRGEDTRTNFTGHLYNSLRQKGISSFIDEVGLQRGEEITPALLNAIQQSRIAIIVFSENYASSTFCLNELLNVLDFVKGEGRLVWPVFYGVDPSHVRHQSGSYGEALKKHEERFQANKETVRKWREALCEAANLSGWHYQQNQHGYQPEYKFINGIIEELCKKINRTPLHIANHPVGLESCVQEVISLLETATDKGVNMVGIYGIGGVGKTTVARAVFNLIGDQFEGLCFLADIREKAINKHGLVQLQETLLFELVAENDIRLGDVGRGIPVIKRRLRQKKVLLILDDVDKLKQLQVTAGGYDWFGFGSRIIITTRDQHLLTTHGVEKLCEVKELNVSKSLELLSWNAFKNNKVDPSYMDVSIRAVSYAGGLPLALEVIGSNLFGRRIEEWNSLLDKYERIPNQEILEILKVSYDNLEDNEKEIFLDIACFFNKSRLSYVKGMLYVRGLHEETGIQVLMEKSLIKIDGSNCVRMHDLIQDMGREIVRLESTVEPGKRSRLWSDEDIVHVLEENTGTEKIEVMKLQFCKDKEVQWSGEAFEKMKNLRILIIGKACFSGGPKYLPNTLRVLDWTGYPSSSLPSGFNPKKLVILSLPESLRIFKPSKMFHSLWLMDFEGCKFLREVPDLSGLPNLGTLCLDNCTNLIRVHSSVGFLNKLRLLSAQACTRLEMLAPEINLTSLETLDLRGCSSLETFPKVSGPMENIIDIYLDETAIEELPFSMKNLIGLKRLYLRRCTRIKQLPSSILMLPKLEVVLAYGSRGFQLFCGEIQEKHRPEVALGTFTLYSLSEIQEKHGRGVALLGTFIVRSVSDVSKGSPTPSRFTGDLNGYCINQSETNFTQVFGLQNTSVNFVLLPRASNGVPHFQNCFGILPLDENLGMVAEKNENPRTMLRTFYLRRESSVSFWFHEKFPKIAVCVIGGSGTEIDNSILDIKLRVFVNGAEQLLCSCNYIVYEKNRGKHIIWCGLQCKHERVISTHKWNHVQVSWELNYHRPYDPYGVISDDNGTPSRNIYLSGIHVYEEENSSIENIQFTNPDISPSQAETMEDNGIFYSPLALSVERRKILLHWLQKDILWRMVNHLTSDIISATRSWNSADHGSRPMREVPLFSLDEDELKEMLEESNYLKRLTANVTRLTRQRGWIVEVDDSRGGLQIAMLGPDVSLPEAGTRRVVFDVTEQLRGYVRGLLAAVVANVGTDLIIFSIFCLTNYNNTPIKENILSTSISSGEVWSDTHGHKDGNAITPALQMIIDAITEKQREVSSSHESIGRMHVWALALDIPEDLCWADGIAEALDASLMGSRSLPVESIDDDKDLEKIHELIRRTTDINLSEFLGYAVSYLVVKFSAFD